MKKQNSKLTAAPQALSIVMIFTILLTNLMSIIHFKLTPTALAEQKYATTSTAVTACDQSSLGSPATAMNEVGDYVIAYSITNDCPGGNSSVMFKVYHQADGVFDPQITEHLMRTASVAASEISQTAPSVSMDTSGNFIITWVENNIIYAQLFDDGISVGSAIVVSSTDTADSPKVSMNFYGGISDPREAVITWHGTKVGSDNDGGIYARHLSVNLTTGLTANGTDHLVNSDQTVGNQTEPTIAMNSLGKSIIAWNDSNSIFIQRFEQNSTLTKVDSNQQINITSNARRPSIAANKSRNTADSYFPGAHFLISYDGGSNNDIYARFINDCDGSCTLENNEMYVNDLRNGMQTRSTIAADFQGNFAISWEDNQSELSPTRIAAQSYQIQYDPASTHGSGKKLGKQFYVDTGEVDTTRTAPSTSMTPSGEYLIAWLSNADSLGAEAEAEIKYQRYYRDAYKPFLTNPNTGESFSVQANQAQINDFDAYLTSTAVGPNNEHIIVWKSVGIYFTLYDANNNIIVAEQRIDTYTDNGLPDESSAATAPTVDFWKDTSGSKTGGFTIVYSGNKPVASDHNPRSAESDEIRNMIISRSYSADGTPLTVPTALIGLNDQNNSYIDPVIKAGYAYYPGDQTAIGHYAVSYLKVQNGVGQITTPEFAYSEYINGDESTPLTITPLSAPLYSYESPIVNKSRLALYPNPSGQDNIVAIWTDSINGTFKDVFMREAVGGVLQNNAINLSSSLLNNNSDPDVAFVSDSKYMAIWNSGAEGYGHVAGSYFEGDFANGIPTKIFGPLSVQESDGSSKYIYPRLSANPETGTILVVSALFNADATRSSINGVFLHPTINPATPYINDSDFKINPMLDTLPSQPSISMNSNGLIMVSWEGSYLEPLNTAGAASQLLLDPQATTTTSFPTINNQQTINKGTASLTITPATINFPDITAKANESQEAIVTGLVFEVSDLDGITPRTISITSSDFTSGNNTIIKDNVYVKNYDGVTPLVDSPQEHARNRPEDGCIGCGDNFDTTDFDEADNIPNNPSNFLLNEETYTYAQLNQTRILVDTLGQGAGKMKFYPALKLIIPEFTVPGTYTGTITITQS